MVITFDIDHIKTVSSNTYDNFFLACEDFGGRFDDPFNTWACFLLLLFFLLGGGD